MGKTRLSEPNEGFPSLLHVLNHWIVGWNLRISLFSLWILPLGGTIYYSTLNNDVVAQKYPSPKGVLMTNIISVMNTDVRRPIC